MKIFIILSLLFVVLFADPIGQTPEQIRKDFEAQQGDKYKYDTLPVFSLGDLMRKNIFTDGQTLERNYPSSAYGLTDLLSAAPCDNLKSGFTGTIYDISLEEGTVTCLIAEVKSVYEPAGFFKVFYPKLKANFSKDLEKAQSDNVALIKKAKEGSKELYDKRDVYLSNQNSSAQNQYLTVPQMLTAAILTDSSIIDVEATKVSRKLKLKEGYNSTYVANDGSGVRDNTGYIMADAATIFDVYIKLAKLSMDYLFFLAAFFAIWGFGRIGFGTLADKLEKQQNNDKKIPFGFGVLSALILFFPTNEYNAVNSVNNPSGQSSSEFEIMKTKFQSFEKTGYYLFSEWADDAAKAIINSEVDSIIDKSGVGNSEQVITAYSGMKLADRQRVFWYDYYNKCYTTYDTTYLKDGDKYIYSGIANNEFPQSEKYASAIASYQPTAGKNYYNKTPEGLVKDGSYSASNQPSGDAEASDFFPAVSFSSCNRAISHYEYFTNRTKDYTASYDELAASINAANSAKLNMISTIIEFQYKLQKTWGFLAILGLPVTKMQTEYIGGLYQERNNAVLDALKAKTKEDSSGMHMLMSSIPYLFVPGAGTVFQVISENSGKFGAAAGGAAAGGATGGLATVFGAMFGGIAGTIGGGMIGAVGAYHVAKAVLTITPIVGLIIIGLVRFIVILIKIFSFHFASLFLLPIAFAKENIQAISKFTMKILATMIELPLFVLSVWLAITANSLIHTVGDIFSKEIIIGMLANNEAGYAGTGDLFMGEWSSKLKIYVFDGFMEVAIAGFAIVIIYKLIISLHSQILEVFDIQTSSIDNSIENMKSEAGSFGGKI